MVSDVEHDLVTRAIEENPELNSMSRKEINLQIKESALEEIVEEKPNRINELEKVLSQLKIDEKQFQSELDDVNTKLDDPNTDEKLLDDLIALQTDLEDKLKTCQSQQGIAEDEIKFFQSNPEELKNQLNEAWNKNVGNIGIIAPRPSWMKHREENKLSPAKNEEALSENEDKFGETNDL